MSRFTGELSVTLLSAKAGRARLNEALRYEAGFEGSRRIVQVPAGFESDGVSAPRPLWPLLPPWGHGATRAAIVHDYGLERLKSGAPHPDMATRRAADREFRIALAACGVGLAPRWLMWAGVRANALLKGDLP